MINLVFFIKSLSGEFFAHMEKYKGAKGEAYARLLRCHPENRPNSPSRFTSSKEHKGNILTRILAQYNVINEREHLDVHHIRV